MSESDWTLETISSLNDIGAEQWNRCANPPNTTVNPFVTHQFLHALELSGSAIGDTGWYAQHLVLRDNTKTVRAVVPGYLKSHSRGEYVFDQAWAEAFQRAGGRYYPKYQIAVPFTPATGQRLLCADGMTNDAITRALSNGIHHLCQSHKLSSAHATFIAENQAQALEKLGWLIRTDTQFHWQNNNYANFDEFLAALSSRKRKNIRKERKAVQQSGVTFEHLRGSDISERHLDAFFEFYLDTGSRKWGTPYLTREFFSLVTEKMANDMLLIMVRSDAGYIAGALNFIGSETLYGRYWGAIEDRPFLHFETCYYQAMEFAIANGLKTVEAGAQGPHKLARGYVPVTTCSAHLITNPDFAAAIKDYLNRERAYVEEDNAILSANAPFRKGIRP